MRVWTFAVVVLFASMPVAHACINSVGTDHEGRRFHSDWYVGKEMTDAMTKRYGRDNWLQRAPSIIEGARTKPDFRNLTDLGILLIYQEQYRKAISHFLAIERLFPGRHETAGNLGTALELAGDDEVALRWIRIGILRNKDEHYRSEWLHARILESKIALAKDPGYLKDRSVAGVAFEQGLVPPLPKAMPPGNDGKPLAPWELDQSLSYQLRERTQFVQPKDPVVANLLLDWATLNLAGGPIESAQALYDLAVAYGAKPDALMRHRQGYIKRVLAQSDKDADEDFACEICEPTPEMD